MYYLEAGAEGAAGAAGAGASVFTGEAGIAALFLGTMVSATDLLLSAVYMYPSARVFTIKKNPKVNVALAKKPVGPFAPKTDSLLPLYAPSPILELFCSKTAMVIAIASTICTINSVDVIISLFKIVHSPINLGIISGLYLNKIEYVMKKRERGKMSTIIKEFSRFAHAYDRHNMIQAEVAKRLVSKLPKKTYTSILDIGAGSGEVAKNLAQNGIDYTHLTAFDSSQNMLDLHPSHPDIDKIQGDFNERAFVSSLPKKEYELILSASALQWSRDLDFTLGELGRLSDTLHAALFTSGTFKTLHKTANVTSPIYNVESLEKVFRRHYKRLAFEVHTYTLHFDSVREMFRYIKKSGVSSGEKKLSFKETKLLMKNYPLDYLEFEVLFVVGRGVLTPTH